MSDELCDRCGKRPWAHVIERSTPSDYKITLYFCDPCTAVYRYEHGWKTIHILDLIDVGKVRKAMLTGTPLAETGLDIHRIGEVEAFLMREEAYQTALRELGKA